MFKQLFGHPARKSITIAFLNDLLNRQGNERITDVFFENTELVKDTSDGKTSRLDILVFTSTGEKINVEIQLFDPHYMPKRMLYYWARLYTTSLKAGQPYNKLPTTIVISLLNFSLFDEIEHLLHTKFQVMETTHYFLFSKSLELHIFNLKHFIPYNWQ